MRTWALAQPPDSSSALSVLLAAVVPSPPKNPLLSHRLDVSMLPYASAIPKPDDCQRRGFPSARCAYEFRK